MSSYFWGEQKDIVRVCTRRHCEFWPRPYYTSMHVIVYLFIYCRREKKKREKRGLSVYGYRICFHPPRRKVYLLCTRAHTHTHGASILNACNVYTHDHQSCGLGVRKSVIYDGTAARLKRDHRPWMENIIIIIIIIIILYVYINKNIKCFYMYCVPVCVFFRFYGGGVRRDE